ncbi:MarR family winged helix-turn-helix transcriptional regulator [Streptomyces sp. T-3]|nr:MarR family winged helix-turn-helix transcriptional regulator [Streptomyces sp. T-3]
MDTFEYSHTDAELLNQPIGYWSWAAHKSVVGHIRAGLAEVDLTQPQWWVLNRADLGEQTREEVTAMLKGYLDVGDALGPEIDNLLERDVITTDAERHLVLTAKGAELLRESKQRQTKTLAQIHQGVSDEELLTTLKVLQRMIHNTDGKAWHH